jgi:hypothetical protein
MFRKTCNAVSKLLGIGAKSPSCFKSASLRCLLPGKLTLLPGSPWAAGGRDLMVQSSISSHSRSALIDCTKGWLVPPSSGITWLSTAPCPMWLTRHARPAGLAL